MVPETLDPSKICRNANQHIRKEPPSFTADLAVDCKVPSVVQCRIISTVETNKIVEIFQGRSQRIELVSKLKQVFFYLL